MAKVQRAVRETSVDQKTTTSIFWLTNIQRMYYLRSHIAESVYGMVTAIDEIVYRIASAWSVSPRGVFFFNLNAITMA